MIQKSEFSDDLEFLDKKYSERERQLLTAESSADLQYFVSFWWAWVGLESWACKRAESRNIKPANGHSKQANHHHILCKLPILHQILLIVFVLFEPAKICG